MVRGTGGPSRGRVHRPAAGGIIVSMTDQKLRELERRWKETRSVKDEAAYLREQVQARRLTIERLRVAAECGHPAAAVAIDRSPITPTDGREEAWLVTLDESRQYMTLICVATQAVASCVALMARQDVDQLRELVDAATAWILSPTEERATACRALAPLGAASELARVLAIVLTWTTPRYYSQLPPDWRLSAAVVEANRQAAQLRGTTLSTVISEARQAVVALLIGPAHAETLRHCHE